MQPKHVPERDGCPAYRNSLVSSSKTAKAREMVERMRHKGDHDRADTWLRIIVAIGELGKPPTEARH
jgi:hypothetical protein